MSAGFLGENSPPVQAEAMIQDAVEAEQRIQAAGEGGDPVSPTDLEAQIRATKDPDELRRLMESQGILWGATA